MQQNEYNNNMLKIFKNCVQDSSLKINKFSHLKSLDFIQSYNLNSLSVFHCRKLIPTFSSTSIKYLQISDCRINTIQDLHLKNIEELDLNKNLVTDIQNIVNYSKLYALDLSYNQNIDISPIQYLYKLKHLNLNNCNLKKINCITTSTLNQLILSRNKIEDIRPLINLTQLEILHLDGTDLKNIIPLQQLTNLMELELSNNTQLNIQPLKYFKSLRKLFLRSCYIQNIEVLRSLVNLEILDLRSNNILLISQLKNLQSLNALSLDHNKIVNFESIERHPNFNTYQYSMCNQQQPTASELVLVRKIVKIEKSNEVLRESSIKLAYTKQYIGTNRRQVSSKIQVQKLNLMSFTNTVVKYYQNVLYTYSKLE
ncbi:Conserved_hypothetical protein [Hexamita inflata]|uniref:Uncharacterized protein n=1 Tax=Hexamita inflata TaxID=28002 RepID=A0AA86UKF3_9EUKA|nr:Conserved hypothetical protein [Hexamita inflata]CAI9961735.1 Conserved hypothetical protein [Hexamita inflata]